MGTRADFYIGTGKDAEWLGSVAFDGYEWADETAVYHPIRLATTEAAYREAITELLKSRDDATVPEQGYPWPWKTSRTTDYAYYFQDGELAWDDRDDWPDMTDRQNVTLGKRSGLLAVVRL